MSALPRSKAVQLLLCLVLFAAAPLAFAQNARVASSPGPDSSERGSEAVSEDDTRGETGPAQRRARASTTGPRSDEAPAGRVPRWHSFLPGMFR